MGKSKGKDPQTSVDTAALTLAGWLEHIQAVHPHEIELGLERVRTVANRLGLPLQDGGDRRLAPSIISVAGTNGKGSCVAMLAAILGAAGLSTGCYTSPHILHYNERIRIDGTPVADAGICEAFQAIESARSEISLSYFEYSTLAALWLFDRARLDVLILEVGLGGRLDAVNIVDADIALISGIDLDHQDWLGDTRELIGLEKAGIMRANRPCVYGDLSLPSTVAQHAAALSAPLYLAGESFRYQETGSGWQWQGTAPSGQLLTLSDLPRPPLDLFNAATVLQALHLLPAPPSSAAIRQGLAEVKLAGRFQQLTDPVSGRRLILDVAHNPQAGSNLASKLQALKERETVVERVAGREPRIHLILAMMHDKDHRGFFDSLEKIVDFWYIAHFDQPRCMPADSLLASLATHAGSRRHETSIAGPFVAVETAYDAAADQADEGDILVACGSFFTVAALMQRLAQPAS